MEIKRAIVGNLRQVPLRITPALTDSYLTRELEGAQLVREGRFDLAADRYYRAARTAPLDKAKGLWLLAAENHVKAGGTDELQKAGYAYSQAARLSQRAEKISNWTLAAENHLAGNQPYEAGFAFNEAAKAADSIGQRQTALGLWRQAAEQYLLGNSRKNAFFAFQAWIRHFSDPVEKKTAWLQAAESYGLINDHFHTAFALEEAAKLTEDRQEAGRYISGPPKTMLDCRTKSETPLFVTAKERKLSTKPKRLTIGC